MTSRAIYEAVLIELNKNNAPSLRLHEFNYLFNKAINEFVDETYQQYDTTQSITDSLRVLQSEATLTPNQIKVSFNGLPNNITNIEGIPTLSKNGPPTSRELNGANFEVFLPEDYLHLLNCTCIYQVLQQNKCYNAGDFVQMPATKLTSDSWSTIMTDVYNRPSPLKPYYYLHNRNSQENIPTNPSKDKTLDNEQIIQVGNDINILYKYKQYYSIDKKIWYTDKKLTTKVPDELAISDSDILVEELEPFSNTIDLNEYTISTIEKPAQTRIANPQKVRMEIRYGRDTSVYKLVAVVVDYVKAPQFIRLTQDQIDLTTDTSQIMEYPDFVCQKIINKLVALLLERSSDPRLTTNVQINRTMAQPTQPQQTT